MPRPRIGIVIPTLDEEADLAETLVIALEQGDQVVVSDGGSGDATGQVAEAHGVAVVSGPPGRGVQLNLGAASLDTEALLFLHADTRLPPDAAEKVRAALTEGAVGGGFLVRWESTRALLRFGGRLTNLRTRLTRCPLGDQAQFCARETFERLDGFREWPILEDLDLARRMKRLGRIELIDSPVSPSVRRYERGGTARTVTTNWLIWLLYFLGASPHRLARLYRTVRSPARRKTWTVKPS